MTMMIGPNCVVSISYKLTNDQGEVLDASPEGETLTYLHGAAGIIPGLEKELTGKTAGDDYKAVITPEDGYGEYRPELIQQVPSDQFPNADQLQVGMQLTGQSENGPIVATVKDIAENIVTVDLNHPLAGMTLHFEGSIADVREATEEEISHGHVH